MSTPGYVQVPADSSGKRVDTAEFTRHDGLTIERQNVGVPDIVTIDADVLRLLLIEARLISHLIAQACNITDNLDTLRNDLDPTKGV
jgi:hypothetical protein